MNLVLALVRNVGTCRPDAKAEGQVGSPHKPESTDAGHRGGAACISDETAVMAAERRGCIVQPDALGQPVRGGARG